MSSHLGDNCIQVTHPPGKPLSLCSGKLDELPHAVPRPYTQPHLLAPGGPAHLVR